MLQIECSVVVAQYNPLYEKIVATLQSIISQTDCRLEIIIADDGSKKNYFKEIEQFFVENNFAEYKLVYNEKNQGTVSNILSGVKKAKGKYIKCISPGDCLYSGETIRKFVDFMNEKNAVEGFGLLACYHCENGQVYMHDKQIPRMLTPYKKKDRNWMINNLLLYRDNISGASTIWERTYFFDALKKIEGKLKYIEDYTNLFTVLDGHDIHFFNEYLVWYEYGTGISTQSNAKWSALGQKDWVSFLLILNEEFPANTLVKKIVDRDVVKMKESLLFRIKRKIYFLFFKCYEVVAYKKSTKEKRMEFLEKYLQFS